MKKVLVSLLISLTAPLGIAGDSWKIRTVLEDGASHRYAMSQDQAIDFEMAGQSQKMKNGSRIEMTQTVEAAKEDRFLLNVVYDRMSSSMNVGGMEMTFDTADETPGEQPMARFQRFLIDKPFNVTVTDRGEIDSVEGFDAIMDDLGEVFADDPALARTLDAIRQGFDDEAMASLLQQSRAVFPEQAVAIGDGWDHSTTISNPAFGELKIDARYVVEGSEKVDGRDCLKLTVSSNIEVGEEGQMFKQLQQLMGGDVDWSIDEATGSGALLIEPTTGLIVDSQQEQRIKMQMSMELPGGAAPEPMAIKAGVVQQLRLQLLE